MQKAYPPGWETGLDADGEADEGYTVWATPSLNLLHPDGTVILKDTPAPPPPDAWKPLNADSITIHSGD